jgi:hypothetical protein
MTANPIEIPQNRRDMSEQSLKQAHAEYENLTDFVTKAMGIWIGVMPANPIATGFKDVQNRVMAFTKENGESALTFAGKVSKASTFHELLTLQTQFVQDGIRAFVTQMLELQHQQLIGEAFQKLQRG